MTPRSVPHSPNRRKPEWNDDQVKALLECDIDDPQTWPDAMHDWLDQATKVTPYGDGFAVNTLEEKRMDVLHEAVYRQCRPALSHCGLLIAALWARIPRDSLDHDLLSDLEEATSEIEDQLVHATAELLPKLERAWPDVTIPQVLEAMGEPRPDRRDIMSDKPIIFAELTAEEKDAVILWRRLTKDQRIMFLLAFMASIIHDRNQQGESD